MTFDETYRAAYGFDAPSIDIAHVLRDGTAAADLPIRIPLRMMNRHGMIAGSTGTGKTRTLQLMAEGLSRAGVPVFLADVKGDLAGMYRSRSWKKRSKAGWRKTWPVRPRAPSRSRSCAGSSGC